MAKVAEHNYDYLQRVYWTYQELAWHFKMLRYIEFGLVQDVKPANMVTVDTVWTNLTTWLTDYVQNTHKRYQLNQTDAIKDIFRTWCSLDESKSVLDHDKAILLRMVFSNAFPGYEMLDVIRFKQHVSLEVKRERFRDELDFDTVDFVAGSNLEAFDKILEAYMNIPVDQCRWTVNNLFINGICVFDEFKEWAPRSAIDNILG